MRFYSSLLLIAGCFLLLAAGSAHAQQPLPESSPPQEDNSDKWERAREIFANLPDDIQQELEAEAQLAYQECTYQTNFSRYHDCECIGAYYLDERVLQGPEENKATILSTVQKECVNEAGVAGQNYSQCMMMNTQIMPTGGLSMEEYCTCYANEMAKAYKENPKMDTRYLKGMMVEVSGRCRGSSPQ